MSEDLENVTRLMGETPRLELRPDHEVNSKTRGTYKRAVTLDIARLDIAISGKVDNIPQIAHLIHNLRRSFALFDQYHELFHATLSEDAKPADTTYYTEILDHYNEAIEKGEEWVKELNQLKEDAALGESEEHDREADSEDRETISHDSTADESPEVDPHLEVPKPSPGKLVKALEQRFDTYTKTTTEALSLITQQLSALTNMGHGIETEAADRRAASTPASVRRKVTFTEEDRRSSMPGLSTIVPEPAEVTRETNRSGSTLDDKALAAVMSMADSFKMIADNSANATRSEPAIKLPKFKLFKFSGKAVDYLPFIKTFETQVESQCKDPAAVLGQLIAQTSGNLQETLQSCMLRRTPEAALARAKEILEERYGRYDDVAHAWLERFHTMNPVTTVTDLFDLVTSMTSCYETLLCVGKLEQFETKMNLAIIINKLPPNIRERWQQKSVDIAKDRKRNVRLYDVIEFCDRIHLEKADVAFGGQLDGTPQDKKHFVKQATKPYAQTKKSYSTQVNSCQEQSPTSTSASQQEEQEPAYNFQASFPQSQTPRHYFRNQPPNRFRHERAPQQQYAPRNPQGPYIPRQPAFKSHPRSCLFCDGPHVLGRCDQMMQKPVDERIRLMKGMNLCLNCLHPKHRTEDCQSVYRCRSCGDTHHSMLHKDKSQLGQTSESVNTATTENHTQPAESVATALVRNKIALPVVETSAIGKDGREHKILAMLDTGSTATVCTDSLLEKLGVPYEDYKTEVSTLTDENMAIKGKLAGFSIRSHHTGKVHHLPRVLARPTLNLSASCRALPVETDKWPHLKGVNIASADHESIDLLIGQNVPALLRQGDTITGSDPYDPQAILSPLGWYISGPVGGRQEADLSYRIIEADVALDKAVENFWRVDDLSACTGQKQMSQTDKRVLEFWEDTITHDGTQYSLPIPLKEIPPNFPDNRAMAEAQLRQLERRLLRDPELCEQYVACITKYIENGYCELVDESIEPLLGWVWYLPHHAVRHPRKPGVVRVVHNCSAKYLGISLNEKVHSGPDLMNKLIEVLLNFRLDREVVAGDIQGMYNQILVDEEYRDCLRFLWWKDGVVGGEVVVYRMRTHLFGGIWSPSCANFVLKRAAKDFGGKFSPETVDMVQRSFYVDDGLKSTSPPARGIKLMKEVKELLKLGGFNFVKLLSNSEEILKALDPADLVKPIEQLLSDADDPEFLLGNGWRPGKDVLVYKAKLPEKPPSKRGVLGSLCSLYDPLGMVTPIIMKAKSIFQECCRKKMSWDEKLSGKLADEWESWKVSVTSMEEIQIGRCVIAARLSLYVGNLLFELHLFSDASETGYGAVSYLLVRQDNAIMGVELLMSKGRLAPLKKMSVPRLELTAAHMAVELERYLDRTLDIPIMASHFHTDSTIVLWYILNEDLRLQTYEANRVSYIAEHTSRTQWNHVPTKLNPADILSRGCLPEELKENYLWMHGPVYLLREKEDWPAIDVSKTVDRSKLAIKKCDEVYGISELWKETMIPEAEKLTMGKFLEYWSSWHSMRKSACYLMKFLKYRVMKTSLIKHGKSEDEARREINAEMLGGPGLSSRDMSRAELALIDYIQREFMWDRKQNAQKQLLKLFPVRIDGMLRVGGRLNKSTLHPHQKNPMVIPIGPVARAVIWDVHVSTAHSGTERVMHEIQQKYWLIRGRRQVRQVLSKCFQCRRYKAPLETPQMADLPQKRVVEERAPFAETGIDYFGPLMVKVGRSQQKRYGCLMTCMKTRAIHLEMAWSLESDSCIKAIMRFARRRGMPKEITSDNGTNFVGANGEMLRAIAVWNKQAIADRFLQRNCTWRFNPPGASHMGGIWERQIRSVRQVLMNVAGSQVLTDESLLTFLCVAEDIINNRPLTPVSSDPRDLGALTPNHLLRLSTDVIMPLGVFDNTDRYRRRWRQVELLADMFWDRWRSEYLPLLQERKKWNQRRRNLMVGDVVIVKEEWTPRNCWPLARVSSTYPDKEGVVRVVDVCTTKGTMRRPVHKLCLIEGSQR